MNGPDKCISLHDGVLTIIAEEVLSDLRSAAWLESEIHPELDLHSRHEMADICEDGNIDRVWRILGLCVAEIRVILHRILLQTGRRHCYLPYSDDDTLLTPVHWHFRFVANLPIDTGKLLKEKIHEFLVARVMADRTAVIISAAARVWQERATDTLEELIQTASTVQLSEGPVRRPLWPM